MTMIGADLRTRILLTLQVALLGMVTAKMQSVLVSWTEESIHIRLIFEGHISSAEIDIAGEIESEVVSHLPDFSVLCHPQSCPPSARVAPLAGEVLVFQRALEAETGRPGRSTEGTS